MSILILDFGSQYTQLIARRIREFDVFSEIQPFNVGLEKIRELAPQGIVLSGGPASTYEDGAPQISPELFELGIPVLGICYGMQLTTKVLGGRVEAGNARQYGSAQLKLEAGDCPLFAGLSGEIRVWMSHGDRIVDLPEGFVCTGTSAHAPVAAAWHQERRIFLVQFHPEVVQTEHGTDMLSHFVEVCGASRDWSMHSFVGQQVERIREQVGDHQVICGLSGGVDSSVAAALVHRAIGDQLTCIFVDNGLLRANEGDEVEQLFHKELGFKLVRVDAADRFLAQLAGVSDPERKRKIIGHEFIEVFDEEAHKLSPRADFLVQGTLYPDVIESVSVRGPSVTIKSHHNVGGLPERMRLQLVEPLRELFKDEVRELGTELGLPDSLLWRHPFPGPGLAVRVLGDLTKQRLDVLRGADKIIIEEIQNADLYRQIWQAFGVLLPVNTVGVMGDKRTYESVLAVRAVESTDGMTADWAKMPYEVMGRISNRIINEVPGINRVAYDISSKPPATIEWE